MKILVIGDLHGRKPVIRNIDFDAIVLIGDVCDDRKIAPLYKKFFRELKKFKKEDTSLDFEAFAAEILGSKKKLKGFEKSSLEEGAKIIRYLDSLGKPIFMVGGNWDQSYGKTKIKDLDKDEYSYMKYFYDSWAGDKLNPTLIKGTKNLRNCMLHLHKYGGVNFIGYGLSSGPEDYSLRNKNKNLTPSQRKGLKKAYEKIVTKLEKAYNGRDKSLPIFFITHNTPYGTPLDVIKDKKSYAYKKHLGSTIAKNFCVKHRPIVCVGGHIHDNPGKTKIGRTLVINPGYGSNAQVLIDYDTRVAKVKSVRFLK